jgi:hypothetical protein
VSLGFYSRHNVKEDWSLSNRPWTDFGKKLVFYVRADLYSAIIGEGEEEK